MNIQSLRPIFGSTSIAWQILQGAQAEGLPKKKITIDVVDISAEALRLSRGGIPPVGESAKSSTATDGYDHRGEKQSARK